ncbi:Cyclin-B2-4 [Camellia lanceoleosa]|uniref:Cyclin-B2-4 n=1 Tax=Camellia lanceoleosa TaxID=1840588 RepID=A0ACC0GF91_9ERIC|nr:Cyclin-B2-4 [Camellia lanceoleosa]
MVGLNENHPGVIRPANIQGGLHPRAGKLAVGIGHNQRVLSTINRNIVGAYPYSYAVNKRPALFENNGLSNKNHLPILPIPAHRPITRKFATQMAAHIHIGFVLIMILIHRKQKKVVQSLPVPIESGDCSITDVDDYNAAGDSLVPMFVQHTEAMLEEIDRMEVEMEYTTDEPVDDIDNSDKRNPLVVSSSCVLPNYMGHQFDINERTRGILIDWLIEVHYKFKLMDETLYLTVNIIDIFLAVQPVGGPSIMYNGVCWLSRNLVTQGLGLWIAFSFVS